MENKEGTKNKNDAFDLRTFSGDVAIFSLGNILLLVFGFIHTLIIPKYLSVEGYGYWQLFMLYGSYGGILHLGFIDGILVRWAGKKLPEIGSEIHIAFKFLLLELVALPVDRVNDSSLCFHFGFGDFFQIYQPGNYQIQIFDYSKCKSGSTIFDRCCYPFHLRLPKLLLRDPHLPCIPYLCFIYIYSLVS